MLVTDFSVSPQEPDTTATIDFLRRFADVMSKGQNAMYLRHAAVLIETMTTRLTAALDEEHLWQEKYAMITRQADAFEVESDTLKHDIDGHLEVISSILAERDSLQT